MWVPSVELNVTHLAPSILKWLLDRKIRGPLPKTEEITGGWRELCEEYLRCWFRNRAMVEEVLGRAASEWGEGTVSSYTVELG